MNPRPLAKKETPSFTKKQESIILVSFFALIAIMILVSAIAINDISIYTAYGGL